MRIDHFLRSRERRTLPLPGRLCSIPADRDDFAGVDEEIHHAVEICAKIEDASTTNQNAHACSLPHPNSLLEERRLWPRRPSQPRSPSQEVQQRHTESDAIGNLVKN